MPPTTAAQPDRPLAQPPARIYYLDWLRVLAILGVFLFHAVHPFDLTAWHIKNAEQSTALTILIAFLYPWGMPFFFLLAGAGSFFALRRRQAGAFARERFQRLLIPFFVGALLLMPPMLYFEWLHKTAAGVLDVPLLDFVLNRHGGFTPIWFGALGYHLWFLGFLFSFSILCLPIFLWLRGEHGGQLLGRLAQLSRRRGALLLWIVPLALVRLALQPFFPQEHSWADFLVQMSFFLLGYVLFARAELLHAVRRDWKLHIAIGLAAAAGAIAIAAATGTLDLQAPPRSLLDIAFWTLIAADGWCWSLFLLYLGMRYLDFTNRTLEYGKYAVLPFFMLHQPVIIVLAYFAVQWPASLWIKLLFVVVGSFCISLGLYEYVIRRSPLLRLLFGMKGEPQDRAPGAIPPPHATQPSPESS